MDTDYGLSHSFEDPRAVANGFTSSKVGVIYLCVIDLNFINVIRTLMFPFIKIS